MPARYMHADGGVYRGQWQGPKKHGLGVYTYPGGARYEGRWADNVKDGLGVYYFPKVTILEKHFQNACRSNMAKDLLLGAGGGAHFTQHCHSACFHPTPVPTCSLVEDSRIYVPSKKLLTGGWTTCSPPQVLILVHCSQGGWYEGEWRKGERQGIGLRVMSSGAVQVVLTRHPTSPSCWVRCGSNSPPLLGPKGHIMTFATPKPFAMLAGWEVAGYRSCGNNGARCV